MSGLSLLTLMKMGIIIFSTIITLLVTALIISVKGSLLHILATIVLTPIICILLLSYLFIGLEQTTGSEVAILEFMGNRPDESRYELKETQCGTSSIRPKREIPLDGFLEGILRPRVVQGWYIYIKGLHTRVGSLDITQRTIEYKTPPDDKIDISEDRGSSYITINKASVPYWITNPVKAFYNVDNSKSIRDSAQTGDLVTGYLSELLIYFDIAVVRAVSESKLNLDELLTDTTKLGPEVTSFLKYKLLHNDIGVGIGDVEVSSANPSPQYLEDRDLQSSREKEEKAALLEYKFLQKQILLLMGYDEDGNRDKSKVPDGAVMTLEQIMQDRHIMSAINKLSNLSINSIGGSIDEVIRNITSKLAIK